MLSVPAGAVGTSATFRIAAQSDGAPELVGVSPITPIYGITPHGVTFATDALVTIPFDSALVPAGGKPFLLRGEPGGDWHVLPDADSIPAAASADIDSLSWYAIGVCTPDSQGYSFGAGDCPGNHELKLEYLDGSGIAIPVQRDALGRALPVFPDITTLTNVTVRVTWTRPAGVNRDDTVGVVRSAASMSGFTAQSTPAYQTVNQQLFTRDYIYQVDPARVSGATGPNGAILRVNASASYSAVAFVLGLGDRIVGWSFDAGIAFRVRYSGVQPVITQQPSSQAVTAGQAATFSVAATGSGLTYQWQRSNDNGQNFSDIPGANAASYTTPATVPSDNGALFQVRVCAAAACVGSGAAFLAVSPSATLPIFLLQPASVSVLSGQTASLTAVAAGPPAPGVQWYKFDGFLGIPVRTPCGSSGTSTACTYTTPVLALADSGSQYYAGAGNSAGSAQSDTVTVTVTSAAVAPSITTQPSDVTVSVGNETTFSVAASGTAPLSYRWSKNGVNIRGVNGSSYRAQNIQATDNGAGFRVEVSNSAGSVTSRNAILTVIAASSGGLDTTFGTGGFVIYDNPAGGWDNIDSGRSIAIDSFGRILIAGRSRIAIGNFDMAIWRYNADGTLDTSFNTTGVVLHNNAGGGNGNDYGESITTDTSGRILVAGRSYNGSSEDMVIWRYNADGTLDTTFNTTGIVVHNSAAGGNSTDSGNAITTDSSGRILVTGYSWNSPVSGSGDMVIWRYNADGTLDTAFNTTGIVVHNNAAGGNGDDLGQSIATDSSGRILVTGNSWNSSGSGSGGMVIWRYNANGTLDTAFNTTGIVVHDNAAGGSIRTDSSGRILVTGGSWNGTNSDMAIWRYDANGTLDTTFGTGGIVVHDSAAGGNNTDSGYAIATDTSGRILVTGRSMNSSGNEDMVIWRYNSTGTPDTTFGTGGTVVHGNAAGGNGLDTGYSIATDTSGRILVVGSSWNGIDNDMAIWRFMP